MRWDGPLYLVDLEGDGVSVDLWAAARASGGAKLCVCLFLPDEEGFGKGVDSCAYIEVGQSLREKRKRWNMPNQGGFAEVWIYVD